MIRSEQAITFFSSLNTAEQVRFLAHFSFHLTIAARDTYTVQGAGLTDPERMRAINEIQHRVCGHIVALLDNHQERYPDSTLVNILLEHGSVKLRSDASWAFEQAIEKLRHEG